MFHEYYFKNELTESVKQKNRIHIGKPLKKSVLPKNIRSDHKTFCHKQVITNFIMLMVRLIKQLRLPEMI